MSKPHSRDGQLSQMEVVSPCCCEPFREQIPDQKPADFIICQHGKLFLTALEKEKSLRLHLNKANPRLQEQPPQKQQCRCLWESHLPAEIRSQKVSMHISGGAPRDEESFNDNNSLINLFSLYITLSVLLQFFLSWNTLPKFHTLVHTMSEPQLQ